MATLEYIQPTPAPGTTLDFEPDLGCLPQVSRTIAREHDAQGILISEQHTITVTGHIVAFGADTDTLQDDITDKIALLEAQLDGGQLRFLENDLEVAWAYDSPGDPNNHESLYGVRIVNKDLPWGPAQHVTNAPYTIVFQADVIPCSNDPVVGSGSFGFSTQEEWDLQGLVSLTFAGRLCSCDGFDVDDIWESIRDTILIPLAEEIFTAAGLPPGPGFGPTRQSLNKLDSKDRCMTFVLGFDPPGISFTGFDDDELFVTATCSIDDNLVRCEITGTYKFTGLPGPTGGSSGSGPLPPIFGGPLTPMGLGGGGGADFDSTKSSAEGFDGIDPTWFFPGGAGGVVPVGTGNDFLITGVRFGYNMEARTISATRVYLLNWIHDENVVKYSEDVSVSAGRPGVTQHRLNPLAGAAGGSVGPPPLPYPQRSGFGGTIITFTMNITSRVEYVSVPPRLTPDADLGNYRIEPAEQRASVPLVDDTQVNIGNNSQTLFLITITQVYSYRDSSDPDIQQIEVLNSNTHTTTSSQPGEGGFTFA